VGAAFRATQSIVVRGGYGITYTPTNTGLLHGPFNFGAAPFSLYLNQTPYGTNPSGVPIGTFSDPRISTPVNLPGADPSAPQNYGTGPNLFQRGGYKDGRVQQWNVFVEKRLSGSWIASIGYTGTHGDRLPSPVSRWFHRIVGSESRRAVNAAPTVRRRTATWRERVT
jgi:hypothetical protein